MLHGWVTSVGLWERRFLSNLDVGACNFQENVPICRDIQHNIERITCTDVRKKSYVIRKIRIIQFPTFSLPWGETIPDLWEIKCSNLKKVVSISNHHNFFLTSCASNFSATVAYSLGF